MPKSVAIPILSALLAGCGAKVPQCSDPKTISLVMDIISGNLARALNKDPRSLASRLSIDLPVPTFLDDKLRRLNCDAELNVDGQRRLSIGYTSVLDEQERHVVILREIPNSSYTQLAYVLLTEPKRETSARNAQMGASGTAKAASKPAATSPLLKVVGRAPIPALEDQVLKSKLQALLKENYRRFYERLGEGKPIELQGSVIVGSGCMQQMCTQEEAAFAVNVDTGQTHALILSKSTISIYGGTPTALPVGLRNWLVARGGKV